MFRILLAVHARDYVKTKSCAFALHRDVHQAFEYVLKIIERPNFLRICSGMRSCLIEFWVVNIGSSEYLTWWKRRTMKWPQTKGVCLARFATSARLVKVAHQSRGWKLGYVFDFVVVSNLL